MKRIVGLVGATALGLGMLGAASSASAQQVQTRTITIDENGHGTITGGDGVVTLSFSLAADPGPGGLASVLTYALPSGTTVVPGDVFLQDLINDHLLTLDVIRFNQPVGTTALPGSIAFYSDNVDGFDALADTSGPPGAFYTNTVTMPELGPEEGPNGAIYTPTANQPGFISGFLTTYVFISDSAVPEPATWAMMLVGFGAIGLAFRRRRGLALA